MHDAHTQGQAHDRTAEQYSLRGRMEARAICHDVVGNRSRVFLVRVGRPLVLEYSGQRARDVRHV